MKSLKQSYVVNTRIENVWNALINPELISKWGAGPAKMKPVEGFSFSLWGGDIFGKNIKVIKNKTLIQEWYAGKWEKPSIVTFLLSQDRNKTKIKLVHENIPDDEFKDIESGWKDYYMLPLKRFVEEKN